MWEYVWKYSKLLGLIAIVWSFCEWLVGGYVDAASLSYGKWMLAALVTEGSYISISLGMFCLSDKAARDFVKRTFAIIKL